MKVLVVNEPFIKDFCRTQRWAARTRGRVLRAPDWLAYATAVLEREGLNVKLYDFPAAGWDKKKLRTLVREERPDFVVLDSTTPSIYSDVECARICKEESGAAVIMVGPHASALPEETLGLDGSVDCVAVGEYDYTVRDVVLSYPELRGVPGICFRDGDEIVRTDPRPLIQNLDDLPFPAWHHLDLMRYHSSSKLHPHVNIISGRGCPYRCVFCLWPQMMHGHKYRLRSAGNVVDEMEHDLKLLPELRRGEFFFEDDTLTANKAHAAAICEEILKRRLEVTWSADARASDHDLELLKLMKRAGCRELCVGFESGDQAMLDRMKKRLTVEQSLRFMETAARAGIEVHGCFVLGLPGETRESMERTIKFALQLGLDTVQFAAAVPYPGTEYFDICAREGLLKTRSWGQWLDEGEQAGVVDYPGLTREEINSYVDRGLRDFYFRPGYMIRFLLKTRNVRDLKRKLRGARKFIGYLSRAS